MPKRGTRNLPSVQYPGQHAVADMDRQLINILGCEIVAHVVVAGSVLAAQLTRQRRKNGAGGERKESAVRDRIHTMAPGVVRLNLEAVAEALVSGQLETVVMAVRAGVQLRHRLLQTD